MYDPTREEMLDVLQDDISAYGADDFDVECAIYWFCAHYHGGQTSNLYEVMSDSDYFPGAMENGPHFLVSRVLYDTLVASFT